jgi:hypothetical protein
VGRHTPSQSHLGEGSGRYVTAEPEPSPALWTGHVPEGPGQAPRLPAKSVSGDPIASRRLKGIAPVLLRKHWLFGCIVVVATVVRLVAMLGYPPGLWTSDSLRYVTLAVHLTPYQIQPVGYSVLLMLLRPLHSLTVDVALQHVMGLATGTLVYATLRHRFRLPAWGATLAAIPPLLSAYAIQIEHFILSDTTFCLLVTIVVALVLWRPDPGVVISALVGLLLAASVLVRSQGLLLAIPVAAYLGGRYLIGRPRAIGRALACVSALGIALAIPLIAYAWWFDQANGTFDLTSSTGAYLYSRVTTFAECSVIKPPADERWMCLSTPVDKRQYPGYYVWAASSPLAHPPGGWAFSNEADRLETNFALRAIEAQPVAYVRSVWHSTFEAFLVHRGPGSGQSQSWYFFPGDTPQSVPSLAKATDYSDRAIYGYDHGEPSTRMVDPYARWILDYQRFVVIPGPLLGAMVLAGLVGMAAAWRRFGGAASLPWIVGAVLIVTPAATADFDARYLVASVPMFCLAIGAGASQLRHYRGREVQADTGGAADPPASEIYLRD